VDDPITSGATVSIVKTLIIGSPNTASSAEATVKLATAPYNPPTITVKVSSPQVKLGDIIVSAT